MKFAIQYEFSYLTPEKVIELRIHGDSPRFIMEMQSLDLPDLTLNDLIEMKIHGLSADKARKMKNLLQNELTTNRLIEISIHA